MQKAKGVRALCEGAIMVALSAVLSYLKIAFLADGGSVDLVMIPLMVFAVRWGGGWGVGASLVYGFIDCLISGGVAYGWQALILDYAVAYSLVGFAGFFHKRPVLGSIAGSAARFAIHVISGVIIWGVWMPDQFMNLPMTNVWVYSLLYNGSYMVPNAVIAAAAIALLARKTALLKRN